MQNLGLLGIKSVHGRYLQAHTDGEMHASNEHRNEEETWFLFEIDKASHKYAFLNWRTRKFLRRDPPACARAEATVIGPAEQWVIVPGSRYGIVNAVALKSVHDGAFLGTNAPGNDTECGGEVACKDPRDPPPNSDMWPGWWVFEAATEPEAGRDFWNTVGGYLRDLGIKLAPVALDALTAALIAG